MSAKEKPAAKPAQKSGDFIPEISETASSMECTGLIPSLARDETELESYGDLFSVSGKPLNDKRES